MKRFLYLFIIVTILVAAIALGITGCTAEEEEDVIKIGVVGPMEFVQGEHQWMGAELAAEEINANGGISVGGKTYQVRLVKVDTNEILDVSDAVTAVEKAHTVDEVDFYIGGFRSEAVAAYTEIVARDYQKLFIMCGPGDAGLLHGRVDVDYDTYKYLFRVSPMATPYVIRVSMLMAADVAMAVRTELGIAQPKIAILTEKAEWTRPLVESVSTAFVELFKLDYLGAWEISPTASDVTAELRAIEATGAHIIYAMLTGPAGIPYARQWGELEIPAASVGVNVEAQNIGFWDATGGYGKYDFSETFIARVKITEETIPFYDKFTARFGQPPMYLASTYDAIYLIKEAIERAGSLETDVIIVEMEKTDKNIVTGRLVFNEFHDVTWGPGYVTGIGVQWLDGEMVTAWPYEWKPDPANAPDLVVTYEGAQPYVLPPRVIEYWKQD